MKYLLWTALFVCHLPAFSQDLIISDYYTTVTSYDRYAIYLDYVTVKNAGIVTTSNNSVRVEWYLSTDDQWQASDILINGSFGGAAITPGATTQVSTWEAYSYINALPGTYYLIIRIVPDPQYTPETDYTNNTVVVPNFVVRPPDVDFTFAALNTAKTTFTQSEIIRITYYMQNLGTTHAGGYANFRFFVSKDATKSSDDIVVPFDGIPDDFDRIFLKGKHGFSSPSTIAVAAPPVTPGNYYLLAVIDEDDTGAQKYEETNENNNVTAVPITIQAADIDLAIVSSDIRYEGEYGPFKGSVTVRNNSATYVTGYTFNVQLVKTGTGVPDPWETPANIGTSLALRSIPPNQQLKINNLAFSQDKRPEPGTYDVVVGINIDRALPERDYLNNVYIPAGQVVIEKPKASGLALHRVTVAGDVDNTALQIPVNLDLENTGDFRDFNQYYSLIIRDAQNEVAAAQGFSVNIDFDPGQSVTKALTMNLYQTLPAGTYQLTITCASQCYTVPAEVVVPLVVTSPRYNVSGYVQGEDGSLINKGKLFLYRKEVSGKIRFTEKVDPYMGGNFTIKADTDPSTLYFIPDPVAYPDYVPTIYGKTITLQPSNFFTSTEDMDVVMEVLKIQFLASGNGIISGRLASDQAAAGRQPMSAESVAGVPIILLSSAGKPVGITYTDESGYFEFKNLPRDSYQILAAFELDAPVQMAPYAVDITTKNVQIDLVLTPNGIAPEESQFFLPQVINFQALTTHRYGDAAITLEAVSDTGLPIAYTSSDEHIATVVESKVMIHAAGEVNIVATQAGNEYYLPAATTRVLTINKALQTISFGALPHQLSTANVFTLQAATSSGLAVYFQSSDQSIISIDGDVATVHKGGVVTITARQAGNGNYEAATDVVREQVVEVVTANEAGSTGGKKLYPNPTTGIVFVDMPGVRHIEVSDITGCVHSQVGWQGQTLDLSQSPAGLYTVKIILSNRTIVTKVLKR